MRIWSIHPKYLDGPGLLGQWKEICLAYCVVNTNRGYSKHSELNRFKDLPNCKNLLLKHMKCVYDEGIKRGYKFKPRHLAAYEPTNETVSLSRLRLFEEVTLYVKKMIERNATERLNLWESECSHPALNPCFKFDGSM